MSEISKERIRQIRKEIPKGTMLYSVIRSVNRNGDSRLIDFFIVSKGKIRYVSGLVSEVTGYKRPPQKEGLRVRGGGMDMGFQVVYVLSRTLYDDGYAVTNSWL